MKICSKCILPATFPGIHFDDHGVCNFCQDFKGEEHLEAKKKEYRQKFEELFKEHIGVKTWI